MKILVVDDSKTARLQVKAAMEDAGHQVVEASSGQVAIDLLLTGDTVDLVLTDQNMPDKSGLEMLQELRKAKGCKNAEALVIFVSSDSSMEVRTMAKSLGVKAFVSKPIKMDKLVELLKIVSPK
jgi:two-component system chemotaxis response regulator CheY